MVRRAATRPRAVVVVVAALGIVSAAVGTFLPWLRSGAVNRDSYEVVALALRLRMVDTAVLRGALVSWSVVPVGAAVGCALFALRLDRTAALLVACSACLIGTVAGFFTVQGGASDTPVAAVSAGPVMSIVGASVALLAACGVFVTKRRGRCHAGTA